MDSPALKDALIAAFRALVPLPATDEAELRRAFSTQAVPARSYLLAQGDICQGLYFVGRGLVRVGLVDPQGTDITTHFVAEHQFVTSYESFLLDQPSPFFIQALEACTLLRIDRYGLQQLYARTASGDRLGRLVAEQLYIGLNRRLVAFYTQSPEARYQELLVTEPHLLQRVQQQHIASYLGVQPQSLSRIKRRVAGG